MGQFKLEIVATGGHGCQREVKDGGTVYGCRQIGCPDCQFWSMVADFARKATGGSIESAKFTHWPGQPGEVVDELPTKLDAPISAYGVLPRVRRGNF